MRITITILITLAWVNLSAQSIRLVRTDVDTSRSSFITASYMFGVDVYVEDVPATNNVSFELHYNNSDFIKYSSYKIGDFGDDGIAFVIPGDDGSGNGILKVGVFSGKPLDSTGFDNPMVLHIDFAVLQSIPDGDIVSLNFVNALATTKEDGEPVSTTLNSVLAEYLVHGYRNVWPGDADNNGIVDPRDFNVVGLFIGTGSRTKGSRSFKRENASMLWSAQRVLVWDNADATFADCDGNGDVTVEDGLTILLNMDSSHADVNSIPNEDKYEPAVQRYSGDEYLLVPLRAAYIEDYVAAFGSIDISGLRNDFEIEGIMPGEGFGNTGVFVLEGFEDRFNAFEFCIGSYSPQFRPAPDEIIAWIALTPKKSFYEIPEIDADIWGMNRQGRRFKIEQLTDVLISDKVSGIEFTTNEIIVNELLNDSKIVIYDIQGRAVYGFESISPSIRISKHALNLQSGIYFLAIESSLSRRTAKFIISE